MAGWGGGRLWLEHLGGSQGGGPLEKGQTSGEGCTFHLGQRESEVPGRCPREDVT